MHEHSKACTKIDSNSFKIIAKGNSDIELLIKESLLIKDYRTSGLIIIIAPLNCVYLINSFSC